MSIARHHAEWLSLVEVSGPFLSMPVLMRVFPQGLEAHDPELFRTLRIAFEEWEDNQEARRPDPAIYSAWIKFVLNQVLRLPDDVILEGQAIPQTLQTSIPEHGELLRPTLVVKNPGGDPNAGKPRLLVQVYPTGQDLDKPVSGKTWKASPGTRMMELLHATGVRLGLITNGEQWMLVDAPRSETTGFASWYAHLWLEEQITLRAFVALLNVERFFNVPDSDTLEALLAESAANQQEVTDQLGYQVRRAVEVLIQSLDQADQDHGRQLLADIPETVLYEAALTVMMRLVFLFCAEERGLLLLGDKLYDQFYAVSTLRAQLRETADQHGEEILERRHDAWCRLLATFRAVHGGVKHDRLTLPAYSGHLFDPDRFPFLEGRKGSTSWRNTPATPLPVNNLTVLHLLEALQILQVKVPGGGPAEARRLSFRALDIEQIGHVYEGLLDHTARRAAEPVLGLAGTREKEPEVPVSKLEELAAKGEDALLEFLKDQTGRSLSALKKAPHRELDLDEANAFQAVCGSDTALWDRIKPFAGLVRFEATATARAYPVVVKADSVYVTAGTDRRSSGTHYTPRSLTGPIVQYTLEPLVFIGPAEGKPKEEWKLRTAAELLDLKICDLACGSGAFLVQSCRYLSERLLEAWETAENTPSPAEGEGRGKGQSLRITPYGQPATGHPTEQLVPTDADERMVYARRIVAQRCLYGVDKNPLAAEMAKLSLWLLTLAKDRPFTFLDHSIRCGDSLVGLSASQIAAFHWDEKHQPEFEATFIRERLERAMEYRAKILSAPENVTHADKEQMLAVADEATEFVRDVGDAVIHAYVSGENGNARAERRDGLLAQVRDYWSNRDPSLRTPLNNAVGALRNSTPPLPPFHWQLEFPEVFGRKNPGFDAIVGNPPFMGGKKISGTYGAQYRDYLVHLVASDRAGNADLCSYFFLRTASLLRSSGSAGLLATNSISQTDTRKVGLEQLLDRGATIYRAVKSQPWPGDATLEIALVWFTNAKSRAACVLDDRLARAIDAFLVPATDLELSDVATLSYNVGKAFLGACVRGIGFVLSPEEATDLLSRDHKNKDVIFPYITGEELNSRPDMSPGRFVINFFDWPRERAEQYRDIFEIVKAKVLPERRKIQHAATRDKGVSRFWQYDAHAKGLFDAMRTLSRVFARSKVANIHSVGTLATDVVPSEQVVVFACDGFDVFAVLQSAFHEVWLRVFSGSLRTDVRYSVGACFETFPFPPLSSCDRGIGQSYFDYRSKLMLQYDAGLTRIYNRFHDDDDITKEMHNLRDMHVAMDKAVSTAYGWADLDLSHGFHETRQGVRFTISEQARREVLARLLKLNHERYAEEVAAGLHDKKKPKSSGGKRGRKQSVDQAETLFGSE